ncbi:hypothetical protein [Actinomadura sp. 7K507]|uniref:hypothetical protein n=1 Tax=Actinomadura sp. 7K507 TaxID=2530365 RepID=UPI001045944D|nr:hypothetical protein [Actinomadura sp. 7K507]TDC88635.1 hypothetical protein E1285_17880 [Actinomadura sp. 7K507]
MLDALGPAFAVVSRSGDVVAETTALCAAYAAGAAVGFWPVGRIAASRRPPGLQDDGSPQPGGRTL